MNSEDTLIVTCIIVFFAKMVVDALFPFLWNITNSIGISVLFFNLGVYVHAKYQKVTSSGDKHSELV
jgi:hypothetical protein